MSFSFNVSSSSKKKKNVFQRQKELEEEKKRRDDEEAAKVYEEFVKDFGEGNDDGDRKAFVRGGVIEPGKRGEGAPPPASKRHYVPSFTPPGMAAALDKKTDSDDKEESVFQLPTSNKGKPRSIDLLLQNLKREQAEREQRKLTNIPEDADQGAFADGGEGLPTNLFLNNLAPDVDESTLMHEFGRFGPIGSVKVMWPRDEEQRRRGRNTGFVAFMTRKDAEKAKEALDGVMLRDMAIAIGWGKCVPLPSVPIWPPPEGLAAAKEVGAPIQAPDAAWQAGIRGRRPADVPLAPPPRQAIIGVGPDVHVRVPEDDRQRFVIDAVAFYVSRDGCDFEQIIMQRELENTDFSFLFDVGSPEHAYYRWRLYSLLSGDSLRSWRVEPFLMVENSNRWFPPPMTMVGKAKTAQKDKSKKEEPPLPNMQRERFEDMLRSLTVERQEICNAMVFALDHVDFAINVADIVIESLTLPETPVPMRIARLFLLSDLLHNSSAPIRNASKYRSRLQDALPDIFESLQQAWKTSDSRISQETLKKHVLKVLRVWRGWFIFTDDFLNGLQAMFLRGSSGPDGSVREYETNDTLEQELKGLADDELETKCKRNGLSRSGGRDAQIERLLQLDGYLHGNTLKKSRWNTETTAGEQPKQATVQPAAEQPKKPSPAAVAEAPRVGFEKVQDDERRKQLRQIEVEVLQYKESLENTGLSAAHIEAKLQGRRKQLIDSMCKRKHEEQAAADDDDDDYDDIPLKRTKK